ncbi:DUF2946 family protein [Methylocystis sp. WRRC1]|uniref:DUF2946 family protein n=1 Tax=Methylocystis sp. WRRC1 TaxID=1732014 RepID=UPI00351D2103
MTLNGRGAGPLASSVRALVAYLVILQIVLAPFAVASAYEQLSDSASVICAGQTKSGKHGQSPPAPVNGSHRDRCCVSLCNAFFGLAARGALLVRLSFRADEDNLQTISFSSDRRRNPASAPQAPRAPPAFTA